MDHPLINISVYVLDDDHEDLDTLRRGFENHRLHYTYFTDSEEVVSSLHDDVHILIIDYYLSGAITGLDVIRRVLERNPDCWVIVLSGNVSNAITISLLNAGADRYVDKNGSDMIGALHAYVEEGVVEVERRLTICKRVLARITETDKIICDASSKLNL